MSGPLSELRLSVVIPALEEAETVATAVHSALRAGADEVVVADGGSRDATRDRAQAAGARVLQAPRRRGAQLNAGAAAARGNVLWFVHADARLSSHGGAAIRRALRDPAVVGGNFRIQFGPGAQARFLTAFYHVIRHLRLFYGDSAIFCRRSAFEAAGRFPPHPIMEDLVLVHRLYRGGRMVSLPEPVLASPRRWEQAGVGQAWASWLVIQGLYFMHVPPATLGRLYRQIR